MALSKILIALSGVAPLFACSVPMCVGSGAEMAPSFTIAIHRDSRPLVGAKVTLEGKTQRVVETGSDGTFRFEGLPAGDYTLSAEYLGLSVAWQCFHIRAKPSRQARGSVTFAWEYDFQDLQEIRGFVSDSYNWHKPESPMPAVRMELQNFSTRQVVARTTSAADGRYLFVEVPEGEYVLVISPSQTPSGIGLDESRLLVRIKASEVARVLNLAIENSTCGSYLVATR